MYVLFISLCLFHCFFWLFVLLAFYTKQTAYINLYYIIPITYILHLFPFHFLNKAKSFFYPDDWEKRNDEVVYSIGVFKEFIFLQKYLEKHCFQSPISPQGMLIFGALTSAFRLKGS
jgi:hypothetical protein